MKHDRNRALLGRALLAALCALSFHLGSAGVITSGDPNAGGIGYFNQITLGFEDTANFSTHVGAWSWEDNTQFSAGEDPVGWTHTSAWVALTLTSPTTLTIRMDRQEGVPWPGSGNPGRLASTASMYPSFTLWTGWDNDFVPQSFADANNSGILTQDWHTYNNDGLVEWAEDLTEMNGFVNNSTQTSAEMTFTLPAGNYSLVLGSNAPATDSNRQGFKATLTTVPEPASALFLGIGTLALGARRQRHTTR